MTLDELNDEQRLELKQQILMDRNEHLGEGTSYGELADADELVDDEVLEAEYGGTEFSPEDFSCSADGNSDDAVMENVARIAADYMGRLVDRLHMEMSSEDVIFAYIIPWAREAEAEYRRTMDEREAKGDYLDWLDEFVEKKMEALDAKQPMVTAGQPFRVRVTWSVHKTFQVPAASKEEALERMRRKVDAGEVSCWDPGWEADDGKDEPRIALEED